MNIDNIDLNKFIEKYIDFVDRVADRYHYESNLKHLLYLIVPAFVIKYDIKNEKHILKVFEEVPMLLSGKEDKVITGSFSRSLTRDGSGYKTIKVIILNEYRTANLIDLLDNIVHEYNHAVNSVNNEITYDDKYVKVRTGLSHIVYDRNTLGFVSKSNKVALEEILNTMQTEEIINIINSFNKKQIDNYEFSSMLYSLKNDLGKEPFKSDAYRYDSYLANELVKNKTFTPTINNLRLNGNVDDIPYLFDNVVGRDGEYERLNDLLTLIHKKEVEYSKRTLFRNLLLNDIKKDSMKVLNLIREYDNKCIFKHTN